MEAEIEELIEGKTVEKPVHEDNTLQNVEKAVERNNGRIHYDIKEKEFCCEVILPICNEN